MGTEKVTEAMAEAMSATLAKVEDVQPEALADYDLIGFGSGIYGYKHYQTLLELMEKTPPMDKRAFVFSTAGNSRERHHTLIKEKLAEKDCTVSRECSCLGQFAGALRFNLNVNGPLAFIAGKNKGYPDEKNRENAHAFARGLLKCVIPRKQTISVIVDVYFMTPHIGRRGSLCYHKKKKLHIKIRILVHVVKVTS
jgi:flavodoxin